VTIARRQAEKGRAPHLPYFDLLLPLLNQGGDRIEVAFGRHVHWGYRPDPSRATGSAADFANAAERLCVELFAGARIATGQTVLDVGCGLGGTICSLDERFRDMRLVGLNIDPRQIQRARARVSPYSDNTVGFVAGNASSLPFPNASCDVVLAVEAIFHFPDPVQFFQEAHRVLKPGGRLALTDYLAAAWVLPSLWPRIGWSYYGDCDVSYSLRRYRCLAASVGFRPVIVRDINANTIPTFYFLHSLRDVLKRYSKAPFYETAALYLMAKLGLWRYSILAFEKDETATAA